MHLDAWNVLVNLDALPHAPLTAELLELLGLLLLHNIIQQ